MRMRGCSFLFQSTLYITTVTLSPGLNLQIPHVVAKQNKNSHNDWSGADTPPLASSPPFLPSLPMTYTPSFGAGCYGNRWHAPSRSSPDRAGNYDIAGSGSGSPSYSQYGSRSTRPGETLQGGEEEPDTDTHTHTKADA